MLENPIFLLGLSIVFAAIPVAIWLFIFFSKVEKSKKTIALIFGLGCLTAPALLGLQYFWQAFPQFNLASLIEDSITSQSTMFIFLFILFGAMEEIIKMVVVRSIDSRTILVNNVNDAIRYSLVAALGFSFSENVYYLYQFWPSISLGELTGMYIFRSIFTACAHMIFSGIFGYYYGIGKFSITINKAQQIAGHTSLSARIIAKIFSLPLSEGFRQGTILKGLFIAILMHSIFNYLLQFNIIIPVIAFVIIGYLYLRYLLNSKAGHLVLINDPTVQRPSRMAKKDEEVVIELLGMWFEQKRYVDVIHICERLLERDPDNEVVQLFKAKALDKIDTTDVYHKILDTVLKNQKDLSGNDRSIITKHVTEKENLGKIKESIKTILEKEGKEFKEPEQMIEPTTKENNQEKEILEKYTGDGTFRL